MKEVTMKLYTFSELSEDVQKSIVERERFNVMGEAMECYSSDWEGSLKKIRETDGYYLARMAGGLLRMLYGKSTFQS